MYVSEVWLLCVGPVVGMCAVVRASLILATDSLSGRKMAQGTSAYSKVILFIEAAFESLPQLLVQA